MRPSVGASDCLVELDGHLWVTSISPRLVYTYLGTGRRTNYPSKAGGRWSKRIPFDHRPRPPVTWGYIVPNEKPRASLGPVFDRCRSAIDTTPTLSKPPSKLVTEATKLIPVIIADIMPNGAGSVELVASHLVSKLNNAGHTLASAYWAVHETVRAGQLQTDVIEIRAPSFGVPNRSWQGPPVIWSGGERGIMHIPEGKPTPYANFKVLATAALWPWWETLVAQAKEVPEPPLDPTLIPAINPPLHQAENSNLLSILRLFTNGVSDERFNDAALILKSKRSANVKLNELAALICIPPTASAEKLGEMLNVTKQAVWKTDWWIQNRKGEKESEIGRRQSKHKNRAENYEPPSNETG